MLAAFLLVCQAGFSQQRTYDDSWEKQGFTLIEDNRSNLIINHSLSEVYFDPVQIDNEEYTSISVPGIFLPNDEGAPNLPGTGRYIAVPQGAEVSFRIIASRSETMAGQLIAPAPRIPLDTEEGPLFYARNDEIYARDVFYPESPVVLSAPMKIRGVDVVMLGITPFQYNPVSKELIIYQDLQIELMVSGGNGQVGEERLRSRWWDPLVKNAVLNPEAIPQISYDVKHTANRSPDYEYIIITENQADFINYANTIKDWRIKQGIRTGVVLT